MLPAFWYLSAGVTRVTATSLAGCWNVWHSPEKALARYSCQSARLPECQDRKSMNVYRAHRLSAARISLFLSSLSVRAPTGRDNNMYGK